MVRFAMHATYRVYATFTIVPKPVYANRGVMLIEGSDCISLCIYDAPYCPHALLPTYSSSKLPI